MRTKISQKLKKEIMKRDNYTCVYCGNLAEHIDHVIPVAWKEINTKENLVASCATCNQKASDKVFNSFEDKRSWLQHRFKTNALEPLEIKNLDIVKVEHWTDGILLEDFDEDDDYGLQVFCLINNLIDLEDLILLEDLL